MPVAEQDIERIGVFRRVSASFEDPPEGYEPILHIKIPIDVDISDLKKGIVRIHYNGKPEIIDKDTKIDVDDKLMQILSKPFPPQGNWAYLRFDGAQLDCSARMLITFHNELLDTMLTELGFDKKLSKSDALKRKIAKLYLIKLIELHDSDFHLKTLIDPRMKTYETIYNPHGLPWFAPPLSVYWHELWAIVNEMKFLDGVKDEISEFVKRKVEEVRKASGVRLYSMIYDIIRFFQNKGLTLDDMIEILQVPTKVNVHPEAWLCYALLDLAEGLDPTQIPYESSIYKVAGYEYDTLAEQMELVREKMLRNLFLRMEQSMYEVIVIGEEAIERKWFCLKPKEIDLAEVILKRQIYYQETFKTYGYLIPTTIHPTNISLLEYQKRGLSIEDLFRKSMNAEISPEKLNLFRDNYNSTTREYVLGKALFETLVRMGFSDKNDYARWLGFKNWDDYMRWRKSVMEIEDDF